MKIHSDVFKFFTPERIVRKNTDISMISRMEDATDRQTDSRQTDRTCP
jgi:hypothetical protein